MATIALQHVDKYYGKYKAANDITFEVKDGEFICLLGPSGCGKTTTLRCIAGLERPDDGNIMLDGKRINDLPPRDRDLAMVFQSYALYPHFKVFDNIAYPLKVRKMDKDEIKKKVNEIAETLGLENLLERMPNQLSGGERQRVALGRALVREPKVFLLDEPLSNVDALLRVHMSAELKRIQKELKITTICVTHDQIEAMTMSDRVVLMKKGEILQVDSPLQIYNHPANKFVASFVGTPPINFFDGTIETEGEKLYLKFKSVCLEIPDNYKTYILEKSGNSQDVTAGIRPESIKINLQKADENSFPAEIYLTEPIGSDIIIDFKFMDTNFKAIVDPTFEAQPGDTIWINFNMAKIHLFNKETEKSII
jgi:multiple sugar transport system ATP-binding protein